MIIYHIVAYYHKCRPASRASGDVARAPNVLHWRPARLLGILYPMTLTALLRSIIFLATTGALLFVSAGRLDLPFFWAFFAVVVTAWVVTLGTMDRGLMQERLKPGPGGTDRRRPLLFLPFFAALLVVAGLDVGRFAWSHVPTWVQILALALVAAGYGLSLWAVRTNRFFSPVVRIQAERGHELITTGPYAIVRHPGYAAALVVMLATAPALGSWWALLPALATAALFFRRIVIEDRFLHANLPGYPAYAQQVRYRLLPGVW
jgi:protein-S-isoprenylcysteine O-methyltransferase Ste14